MASRSIDPAAAGPHGAAQLNKIVSAADAVGLIHDGDTVATGGFVGIGFAENIAVALERRFLESAAAAAPGAGAGHPRDLTPVGKPVPAIVNYDNFSIAPELLDDYVAMVNGLTERYYSRVTRYTHSAFMRAHVGEAFRRSRQEPALYASPAQALSRLKDGAG